MTGTESIMILLPSPRHRKDGSPHDGGGEMPMCAAKHSLYCFFLFIGFHQEIGLFADESL